MRLRKGPVWLAGFVAIVAVIGGGFAAKDREVIMAGLDALVWHLAIGLGINLGVAVQRSIWYKPELDKKEVP